MESLSVLFFLLILPHPSCLYSLHNCTIDSKDQKKIDCHGYQLSRIPGDIPKTAINLSLQNNNIGSIHQSDFSGYTELQALDLSWNRIGHIEDKTFSHLSSLTQLSLYGNRLTDLTEHMFIGLVNLTVLKIGFNKIRHISQSVFIPLINLQMLDLSVNNLTSIRDIVDTCSVCRLLKSIDLSYNPITLVESEQFPFSWNISDLDLSYTTLSRFTLRSDVFPCLQSLRLTSIETKLQWNISDKAFLKSLRTLDLSFTKFNTATYKLIFQSLYSLENLGLSGVGRLDRGLLEWACGIPMLKTLDLTFSNISILQDSLLLPCSNLTELDLTNNFLTDLAPSSLKKWTHLSKLNLQWNSLTRVPVTIRNLSSLTHLSLNSNHIGKLDCVDFSGLHKLTVLDLSANRLTVLNSCILKDLKSLKMLIIRKDNIVQFDDSFGLSLPNLQVMNAAGNKIARLQKGVLRNMSHLIDLQLNSDSVRGTFVEEGVFDGLMELRNLSFSPPAYPWYQSSSRGHSQLFNLPSLQRLDLTLVKSCFVSSANFFQGLDNLKMLSLHLSFCSPDVSVIFYYIPQLLSLELRKNKIWIPVPELFRPLSYLQTLDLSDNHLKSLDFLWESNLTQLQTLILRDNDLSLINERVFEVLPSLRYLDLSQNPFICDCSNVDFILWTIMNPKVYVSGAFQYRCASPPSQQGMFLLEFNIRSCSESVALLCFIFSSSLVLLTLFSTFLHHFLRFHLLYGFYLLRAFLYHRQKRRQGCEELYDAFVSYNVHDEEWVYRELVPELEERQGWRLCLHHRDFEPGKAILENITDAIYSSRKTLCVISHKYLLSEWCSREIQMASFRLLDEQKDVLILLFLEEISSSQLSPFFRMRKLLRNRTYLSWSKNRGHRGLFWERVRHALQFGAQLSADNPLPLDA